MADNEGNVQNVVNDAQQIVFNSQLLGLLQKIFRDSFIHFSVDWEENSAPEHQDIDRDLITNILSSLSFEEKKGTLDKLGIFLWQSFIRLRVRAFIELETDDERFLQLYAAFIECFERICKEVDELFGQHEGHRVVELQLRSHGLNRLYFEFRERLMRVFIMRIEKTREFAYTLVQVYDGLVSSNFAKLTAGFAEFFNERDYFYCLSVFSSSAKRYVSYVLQRMSAHITEKSFLVTKRACIHAEILMFTKLFDAPVAEVNTLRSYINNQFCLVHTDRKEAGLFEDIMQLLVTPEIRFDHTILRDVFNMYTTGGSNIKDVFMTETKYKIREKFIPIFKNYAPVTDNVNSGRVELFRNCMKLLSDRAKIIEQRLALIPNVPELYLWLSDASSELFTAPGVHNQVLKFLEDARKEAINYLYVMEGTDDVNVSEDEEKQIKLIRGLFRFIDHRLLFMQELFEKMQGTFLNNRPVISRRYKYFQNLDHVRNGIPSYITNLVNDISASEANTAHIRQHYQVSNKFKSSFVFKETDWEALRDKENLLIPPPEEFLNVQTSTQQFLNLTNGDNREIRPVHALATTTIKSRRFAKNRPFVRIHLLLYQAMLLKLFERTPRIQLRDIYRALIREDIQDDGSSKRAEAEDVVLRLIVSLQEPSERQLLTSNFDVDYPDPSAFVTICYNQFEEEEVSLLGQNLVQEEILWQPPNNY